MRTVLCLFHEICLVLTAQSTCATHNRHTWSFRTECLLRGLQWSQTDSSCRILGAAQEMTQNAAYFRLHPWECVCAKGCSAVFSLRCILTNTKSNQQNQAKGRRSLFVKGVFDTLAANLQISHLSYWSSLRATVCGGEHSGYCAPQCTAHTLQLY